MWMPDPPRIGVSGSLTIPPAPKRGPTKKAKKRVVVVDDPPSEVIEHDSSQDDALEIRILGRKGDSDIGEDDDSSPSSDDEHLSTILTDYLSMTAAVPPPPPAAKKKKKSATVQPDAPLTHESVMRRLLDEPVDAPLPESLTKYDGPISLNQLHEYHTDMLRLNIGVSSGLSGPTNAMRLLQTHVQPTAPMTDAYEKYVKPYCQTKDFANLPVHDHIGQGNYRMLSD